LEPDAFEKLLEDADARSQRDPLDSMNLTV
jgi:hypothetical protein